MFDKKLKEQSFNTYKFSNHDINKFILLLWKGVCHFEYMGDWENLIIKKEIFYSHINMKNIVDTNGTHTNKILK